MTADWFFAALRHDRAVVLGSLALVVVLAWAWLLVGAGIDMEEMDMGGGRMMLMAPEWSPGYGLIVFAMWAVMMVAMMLPSAAPITLLVAGIARRRAAPEGLQPAGSSRGGASGAGTALFVLGYLAVWLVFAAVATLLQWGLDEAGLLSDTMALANRVLAAAVLIAAGIYQWTPLKEACLRHCRSPLAFLLFHWREGGLGALTSGLGQGAYCLGCCWMLMALLFVGGIMSLAWIAAIALLVLIEKTLPWGGWMGRITGVVLVAWGAVALAMAA